jgi:hypothetical protein
MPFLSFVLAIGDAAKPGSNMLKIAESLPSKVEVISAHRADSITEGFATIRQKLLRHMKIDINAWTEGARSFQQRPSVASKQSRLRVPSSSFAKPSLHESAGFADSRKPPGEGHPKSGGGFRKSKGEGFQKTSFHEGARKSQGSGQSSICRNPQPCQRSGCPFRHE